jgi:hypothetical protein
MKKMSDNTILKMVKCEGFENCENFVVEDTAYCCRGCMKYGKCNPECIPNKSDESVTHGQWMIDHARQAK